MIGELCCDGVCGGGRFPQSLGLQREAPPRSERYGVGEEVVRWVAGAHGLPRHLRVPCSLAGVGNGVRVAPPRTLVSSDVGVFGASSACLLV